MTDYDVKVPGRMLSSLMTEKGGFAELLEMMLNQVFLLGVNLLVMLLGCDHDPNGLRRVNHVPVGKLSLIAVSIFSRRPSEKTGSHLGIDCRTTGRSRGFM